MPDAETRSNRRTKRREAPSRRRRAQSEGKRRIEGQRLERTQRSRPRAQAGHDASRPGFPRRHSDERREARAAQRCDARCFRKPRPRCTPRADGSRERRAIARNAHGAVREPWRHPAGDRSDHLTGMSRAVRSGSPTPNLGYTCLVVQRFALRLSAVTTAVACLERSHCGRARFAGHLTFEFSGHRDGRRPALWSAATRG